MIYTWVRSTVVEMSRPRPSIQLVILLLNLSVLLGVGGPSIAIAEPTANAFPFAHDADGWLRAAADLEEETVAPQPALVIEGEGENPTGWGPSDLQAAYKIPTWGGAGHTVAVIAVGDHPNADKDLALYRSHYGLPACTEANGCFKKVNENGASAPLPPPDTGAWPSPPPPPGVWPDTGLWIIEIALDLQMVSAACPECKILLVEAENSLAGLTKAANTAAALGATEISNSWVIKDGSYSCGKSAFEYPGTVVTAASGDWGYLNHLHKTFKGGASYPAACPGVLAVGGTELTKAPKTPRGWTDNVWPESGGGCTVARSKPVWQEDKGCAQRMTNDIAIVAKGVSIYNSYPPWTGAPAGTGTGWLEMGGTSVGAPLIAGIFARMREPAHKEPVKAIYSNRFDGFGTIFDIGPDKTLNNTNYSGGSCSPLYMCNAVAGKDGDPMLGYDGPTGVGIPQGVPALPKWVLAHSKNVVFDFFVDGMPDIDCASPTMCMAVGAEAPNGAWPMAAEWDGYRWSIVPVPSQNKYAEDLGKLRGVSCPMTNFCLAVGEISRSGYQETYVLQWGGSQWVLDESAPSLSPQSIFDAPFSVSCASANDCMIVGGETSAWHGNMRMESLHLTGSGWSTPEVPAPSGTSGAGLRKVSCAAEKVEGEEEVCLAAGWLYSEAAESFQVFVERWDGSKWSVDTSLNPPGVQSELWDVSCPAVDSCMAIGWMAQSPENYKYEDSIPISEHWNGSEWVLGKPPLPEPDGETAEEEAEEEEGEAYGVSCGTPTSCIAVGINFGTGYIIGGWNGTSWSEQEPPEMSPGAYYMPTEVDCVTVDYCQVMGAGGGSFFNILTEDPPPPVLEGTIGFGSGGYEALLLGTVVPNGSPATYQYEYGTTANYGSKAPASPKSIGSGTGAIEVSEKIEGLQPETTYHFRLVATNEKGTVESEDQTFTTPGWNILSTPNPSGASDSNLHDVSCEPSTNVCTAVGKSTASGVNSPVVQRWNGTSWSEQAAAKKSGSAHNRLFGVDCPSETRCIAVGNYQNSEGGPAALAELWNEGKWNVQTTPVPSEATSSELVAVGCSWTSECKAVGSAVIGGVKTAIAERWDSPTWALQSVPIPEGSTSSQLDGVDCIWSNVCVAVGRYTAGGSTKSLAMLWNGTNWSLQTLTSPEGAVQSTLLDVSCTKSPTRCTAVGGWKNSANAQFTLAYRFNGSTWTLQSTPNPSGSSASVFQEVSCATETSCTAAGSSVSGGSTKTLAEKWDGTSWSIQGTPNPTSATFSAFFGVSCRSTTCMGVGWSTDGSGVDTTLAETSDLSEPPTIKTKSAFSPAPTEATLNSTVDPNGAETTYQFEYGTTISYGSKASASPKSIGSGTSPVEVSEKIEGLAPETTYHFRVVATNTKGTTEGPDQTFTTPSWGILSTPNPSGASDSNLHDVSCEPSTSVCTAVGKSTVSGADVPVAQRWNGTSWSAQSPAKKSGTLPTRLFGVDCPSETRCLTAGNYQPSEGGPVLLTEIWNEGKWNVQSTPVPSEATSSELVAIGCNSTAQCRAAGSAVIGGVKTAIIEAWTSPNWTLQTVPIPEGASSSQLDGIDCIWSNVCVAVGRYTASGGSVKKLAMLWDGTNWSLQTLADPEGAVETTLLDVSCTKSPTRCTAVGGWKNSAGEQFTLAYRFNGSTWTLQSTPNPSGATESVFQDVSCATETSCTAAGSSVGGGSTKTLAEKWNGTSWSIQGTPNPSGAAFSSLFGVSCQSTTCMGVGWSTNGSGVDTTLAEIRE